MAERGVCDMARNLVTLAHHASLKMQYFGTSKESAVCRTVRGVRVSHSTPPFFRIFAYARIQKFECFVEPVWKKQKDVSCHDEKVPGGCLGRDLFYPNSLFPREECAYTHGTLQEAFTAVGHTAARLIVYDHISTRMQTCSPLARCGASQITIPRWCVVLVGQWVLKSILRCPTLVDSNTVARIETLLQHNVLSR